MCACATCYLSWDAPQRIESYFNTCLCLKMRENTLSERTRCKENLDHLLSRCKRKALTAVQVVEPNWRMETGSDDLGLCCLPVALPLTQCGHQLRYGRWSVLFCSYSSVSGSPGCRNVLVVVSPSSIIAELFSYLRQTRHHPNNV